MGPVICTDVHALLGSLTLHTKRLALQALYNSSGEGQLLIFSSYLQPGVRDSQHHAQKWTLRGKMVVAMQGRSLLCLVTALEAGPRTLVPIQMTP